MQLLLAVAVSAQTQRGYVKTKGRLSGNGTVVKGTRLSGATVMVRGMNAVVSGGNGTFSLSIPTSGYYLQNVQKQGYVLTDPDVLSRQYAYSKNPLVLVLEDQTQQATDRLEAERKIRRTLRRQLQEREDELEALKEQQKVTEDEYRRQLQELYAHQESNEKLISEMAERYAKTDFDEVDEFNRRISSLILEGRLTEADSLLNTKGDINSRAGQLRLHQEANAQAEQELKKKQKKLEKSIAMAKKELEDLAQDCYSKFEIFKMQHQNDSASRYIRLRADLDTLNIQWALEAGNFLYRYLSQFDNAEKLFKRAQCSAKALTDGHQERLIECYNAIAALFSQKGDIDQASTYYNLAMESCRNIYGEHHVETAVILMNKANILRKQGKVKEALVMAIQSDSILQDCQDVPIAYQIKSNGALGNMYASMNNYSKALQYYQRSFSILETRQNAYPLETITTCTNIGCAYNELGQYDEAENWDNKAISLIEQVLGNEHPRMADILNNIGAIYQKKKQPERTLECVETAIAIERKCFGRNSPHLIISYNNLAFIQNILKQYDASLSSYSDALALCRHHLPSDHPYVATILNGIGSVYYGRKDYDKAMEYFEKTLDIRLKKFGESNVAVAMVYMNIGNIWKVRQDANQARDYFTKAKDIFIKKLGENHPRTKLAQKELDGLSEGTE